MCKITNLQREHMYLVHSFRSSSPWPIGPTDFGPIAQCCGDHLEEWNCSTHGQGLRVRVCHYGRKAPSAAKNFIC
jgi:hypothetical protein